MKDKLSPAEALRKNRNVNGRPKKSATEKMTKKVTVKFAVVEYYLLSNKAKEAGVNLSVFIRSALQNSTVRERLREPEATKYRIYDSLVRNVHYQNRGRSWNEDSEMTVSK